MVGMKKRPHRQAKVEEGSRARSNSCAQDKLDLLVKGGDELKSEGEEEVEDAADKEQRPALRKWQGRQRRRPELMKHDETVTLRRAHPRPSLNMCTR